MAPEQKTFDKVAFTCWLLAFIGVLGGIGLLLYALLALKTTTEAVSFPQVGVENSDETAKTALSSLTGLPLAAGESATAPVYCIQTPNGVDGARPQVGLTEAGVVFEAIAEGGITRFAAIYQNPQSAVIGPIRSLRMYYLQWDTPFDCTVVHAGGAADAIAALHAGDYSEIDENNTSMFRSTYGNRLWNNLFTTATMLDGTRQSASHPEGFSRMTPAEAEQAYVDATAVESLSIIRPAEGDTSAQAGEVHRISIDFASGLDFGVEYEYDAATNTYKRSFASGLPHEVYKCPAEDLGAVNPEQVCSFTTLAPSVVIAMMVKEERADDGVHEKITTLGTGTAYIFQNGQAIEGTWSKASADDQIKFFDASGNAVKLGVGQTWISAVPTYGAVYY